MTLSHVMQRIVADRRRWLVVGLSLALHAAVLIPLALSVGRLTAPPSPVQLRAIPVDLTPWPRLASSRVASSPLRPRTRPIDAETARTLGVPLAAAVEAPRPSTAPQVVADAPTGPADPWRVRSGLGPPARLPCPPAPGDRLGQRLCAVGPTPTNDDDAPTTYAEVRPSRRDRSDTAREEGFDRQVEANEAWREYTRGEGAYPGLRSLFKQR